MTTISFKDVRVTDASRLDVHCEISDDAGATTIPLWFEFNRPTLFTQDTIALGLSTLCGRAYKEIRCDLKPSPDAAAVIERFTGARLHASEYSPRTDMTRAGIVLSFSGGFDSLAAWSLMPRDTQLVSMDFGGHFSRERSFFERFDPLIVSTNLIETPFRTNSWTFMGLGIIFASAHHRAAYHTFGNILEASSDSLRPDSQGAKVLTSAPFVGTGMLNAPYVLGLTEIGTLLVTMVYQQEHIKDSLRSVSNPGEEKLYRKQVLAQLVSERGGYDLDLDLGVSVKPPAPRYSFGQNFALDFLSFYFVKFGGEDLASELVADIPMEVIAAARSLRLDFYERANSTLYENFPKPLRTDLMMRLATANIGFYTESDWREFAEVRRILANYHPSILR